MLSILSYKVYALKAAALSLPNSALFDGAYCTPSEHMLSEPPAIYRPSPDEYDTLIEIWERSVRATHHFLDKNTIGSLRNLIRQKYFFSVTLAAWRGDDGIPVGFVGVGGVNIEMLFVDPKAHGTGVGKQLLLYAIRVLGASTVDVNEQNPSALGFYRHMGFELIGRSPTDNEGKSFPLLHMRLKNSNI